MIRFPNPMGGLMGSGSAARDVARRTAPLAPAAHPAPAPAPTPQQRPRVVLSPRQSSARALTSPSLATCRGQILVALAEHGPEGSPVVELLLALWRQDPARWSIQGHPEHPDTNKVLAKLAQLCTDGYAHRPAVGQIAITAEGRRRLERGRL